MDILITIIMMLICYFISSTYYHYYHTEKIELEKCIVFSKSNIFILMQLIIITVSGYILFKTMDVFFTGFYKYMLLLSLVFVAAMLDYKFKKIPNVLCLMILMVAVVFDGYQLLQELGFSLSYAFSYLLGGIIAFGFFMLTYLISRGGMGAGDVKLMTCIGLAVGGAHIIDVIFYTILCCGVFAGIGCLIKRINIKDTLPMAPFMYLGVLTHFIMIFIS